MVRPRRHLTVLTSQAVMWVKPKSQHQIQDQDHTTREGNQDHRTYNSRPRPSQNSWWRWLYLMDAYYNVLWLSQLTFSSENWDIIDQWPPLEVWQIGHKSALLYQMWSWGNCVHSGPITRTLTTADYSKLLLGLVNVCGRANHLGM